MANRLVLFPAGKSAQRNAYADWADAQYATITGGSSIFTYRREDAFGQPYCAYLGPPFAYGGNVVQEPNDGAAMRADGVLVDRVTLPED